MCTEPESLEAGDLMEQRISVRCFVEVRERGKVVRRLAKNRDFRPTEEQEIPAHSYFRKKKCLESSPFSFWCLVHDSKLTWLLSSDSPAFNGKAKMVCAERNQPSLIVILFSCSNSCFC